jgi:hypothetical protein
LFHGWLIQQLTAANVSLGQSLAELPRVLDAIRNPDTALRSIDETTEKLEAMLAELRDELRRIAAGAQPGQVPARSHTQTISGNARVNTAISGDVHGNITSIQQSGGVNFGSGNRIGRIGDVVAGDKVMGDKVAGNKTVNQGPQIFGNITSGRDTNIATTQMINNAASPHPPTDPPPTPATTPPELRLWLANTDGQPLSTLAVGSEAALHLSPAPDVTLPDLDLQLEADGAGIDWPEGTRRTLKLRGGVTQRPARWILVPEQPGELTIRVLVLVEGRLAQQLALTVRCADTSEAAVLSSKAGATSAEHALPTIAVGLTLSSVPSMPTHANALTLVFDREREGYSLRLIDGGSVTVCPIALTDTGLSDLLAEARNRLLAIVHRSEGLNNIFQQPDPTIPSPHAETALAQLAQVGAWLWQTLFAGTGSSSDALALGERLRARSQAAPLHLTIAAARLPFPWPLLYDRDPNQPITPDGFWGFRHVLASLPTSGRAGPKSGDLALGPAQELNALVGLNLRIDQHPSVVGHPVIPGQRQALSQLKLKISELTTEVELRDALAAGSDAALVYLYCHVLSVTPGGAPVRPGTGSAPGVANTRIVLTEPKQALALRDLQLAAPLSRASLLCGGPLVLLNACGSAELSPLTYEGLAPYLLDLGARAVIGTECETPIYFGAAFGPALLRAVVTERLTVGEALRATRRLFLEQHHNPLGLLYALHGSSDLQVQE